MKLSIHDKISGYLFLSTGIFALISSLFAWGNGWLFSIKNLDLFLMPMADLIVIGPVSIISAIGILKLKKWGAKFGILTAGAYIFSSVLVFIKLYWHGQPFPLKLIIPSVTGFIFGISFFIYELKRN